MKRRSRFQPPVPDRRDRPRCPSGRLPCRPVGGGASVSAPSSSTPAPSSSAPSGDLTQRRPVYHPGYQKVKPKIGKNVLGCVLYTLLVIVVFAGIVIIAVAMSGIIAVPIVSQKFYAPPAPTRAVQAGEENPQVLLDAIGRAIASSSTTNVRTPHLVEYKEAELTAAARGALADAAKRGDVIIDRTQVVVRPDAIEITGRFRVKGIMLDAQFNVVPSVADGVIKLAIVKARLGDIPISPAIAKIILDTALGRDSSTWDLVIAEHEVQSIRLEDGAVELTLY